MPGVLIIEAMAQVGGVLAGFSMPKDMKKMVLGFLLCGHGQGEIQEAGGSGDQLVFELVTLRTGSRVWKMAGKAFVNEELVAEAELIATIA